MNAPLLSHLHKVFAYCMLLTSVSCSSTEPNVYALSEIGQLKQIYRYSIASMDPNLVSVDASVAIRTYVKQFQVTKLNNGAAFVSATLLSESGVIPVVEYMIVNETISNVGYFDSSSACVYYTIDLTGLQPSLTIEADFDGDRSNNTVVTVLATKVY